MRKSFQNEANTDVDLLKITPKYHNTAVNSLKCIGNSGGACFLNLLTTIYS